MDITPELIAEIDFPDSLKGFDKDAVDDFLGQVGTELGRVQYELRNAQRRITDLEDEVATAAKAPPVSAESDAVKATRTIMAAEETADRIESAASTEAEKTLAKANDEATTMVEVADSEAKRLLADAHSNADRLEGDTRREADELLVAARRRAEDEYDARVADYVRLLGEQEQRSDALADDVDSLEGRVGEYRSVLERLIESVRRVLDDPDELRFRPTLELTAPAVPTGSPAPVPGSVMPEEAGSDTDQTWEPGSWSGAVSDDGEVPTAEGDGDGADEALDAAGEDSLEPSDDIQDVDDSRAEGAEAGVGEPVPNDRTQAHPIIAGGGDVAGDDATRDDLSFSELANEPTGPGVDLTGEYRELGGTASSGDAPLGADHEGGLPSQLQAFDGDVDPAGAQPREAKKFGDTPGAVPSASTGPDRHAADDAFTESGSPRTPEPPEIPAGVEFVDMGDDQPGSAAFSAAPGAFAGDDPFLTDLQEAVNDPDDAQAFSEFENDDESDDQKGLRRFFGK